jgi:inward rectifier potassium channel
MFFATAAAIFVTLNTIFAFFYWLGDLPIANVSDDLPLSLFYFSIETVATVGYSDMHPQTDYGHLVATVEIFTGMSFLAGMIAARSFSTPTMLSTRVRLTRLTSSASWRRRRGRRVAR